MLRTLSRPICTVLRWQALATVVMMLAGGLAAGAHGAFSAALGGLVAVVAGFAAGWVAAKGGAQSAEGMVVAALTAEAVKIGLIVLLLWLVLTTYEAVVVLAFIGSFLVAALIFAMAFFVRDH